jgi:hypothetical protein
LSWWAAEGATLRLEDPDFAETFDRADEKLSLRAVKLSASERMGITS